MENTVVQALPHTQRITAWHPCPLRLSQRRNNLSPGLLRSHFPTQICGLELQDEDV